MVSLEFFIDIILRQHYDLGVDKLLIEMSTRNISSMVKVAGA